MSKRVAVGAHYGLFHWIVQQATSVIMALYSIVLVLCLLVVAPQDYTAWRGIFGHGLMQAATFLFLLSLYWHAWIGVRDIWMDYIKPIWLRVILHVATVAVLVLYTGWTIRIIWGLAP